MESLQFVVIDRDALQLITSRFKSIQVTTICSNRSFTSSFTTSRSNKDFLRFK